MEATRLALGEDGFVDAWGEGLALTLGEAIEYALREQDAFRWSPRPAG